MYVGKGGRRERIDCGPASIALCTYRMNEVGSSSDNGPLLLLATFAPHRAKGSHSKYTYFRISNI